MVTQQSLKDKFDEKASSIEAAVSGISEDQASKRPAEGEWSLRDVLCHLSGDAEHSFREDLNRFLTEDMPSIDITPGELYWTPERKNLPLPELAKSVARQYSDIGTLVAGLTPEQLARPGRIAFLKQFRGTDEIKLGEWIGVISEFHLNDHISQLQALCK